MFDLAVFPQSQELIKQFYEKDKIISAVCHGPAALANVKLVDGTYLVNGQEVTAFSNAEEDLVQLSSVMPFMLETQLQKNGAKFIKANDPWGAKVVRSGRLLTGQNPSSAAPLGEAVLTAIQ